VLEVVENSAKHLDAETVYRQAQETDPNISLATVYRTLAVLKDEGLIEQRYLARDHAREHYEPVGAPEHYHFTCLDCRQVIEFQSSRVN
jgi:Fur family transcriptional regulator, ferric uptake regulator